MAYVHSSHFHSLTSAAMQYILFGISAKKKELQARLPDVH